MLLLLKNYVKFEICVSHTIPAYIPHAKTIQQQKLPPDPGIFLQQHLFWLVSPKPATEYGTII